MLFRAKVWWNRYKTLPSIKEIEQIWDIPSIPQGTPETPELKQRCERKEELLIWCLDHFLVPVAGPDFWGPDIRHCWKCSLIRTVIDY